MLRAFFVVLALLLAPLPLSAAEPATNALLRQVGVDVLFRDFGNALTASPRRHGVSDKRFLASWEKCASRAFDGDALSRRLGDRLATTLTPDEIAGVGAYLASPAGQRLTQLERATQTIAPERQIEALARGKLLYLNASDTRRARFDDVITLSGAEMTFAMLGESLRGMALGLRLADRGDIQQSWSEIDAEANTKLDGMMESLLDATRATLALTYAELSDSELDAYLEFLRRPATRKFYGTMTLAVGEIMRETMFGIGQDVAARLNAVAI